MTCMVVHQNMQERIIQVEIIPISRKKIDGALDKFQVPTGRKFFNTAKYLR